MVFYLYLPQNRRYEAETYSKGRGGDEHPLEKRRKHVHQGYSGGHARAEAQLQYGGDSGPLSGGKGIRGAQAHGQLVSVQCRGERAGVQGADCWGRGVEILRQFVHQSGLAVRGGGEDGT